MNIPYVHLGVAALLALCVLFLPAIMAVAGRASDRLMTWAGMGAAYLHAGIANATAGTETRAVEKLKETRNEVVVQMRSMLDAADKEDRDLNEDEQKEYDQLEEQRKSLTARIARAEHLEAEERALGTSAGVSPAARPNSRSTGSPGHTDSREFRNAGEFLYAVRFNRGDPRLRDLYSEDLGGDSGDESRALSMGTDTAGGFAVPTQIADRLLEVRPQDAIVEPRAMVIPAGDPPDAAYTIPALDQTGVGQNIYGGVVVEWIEEGDEKPETNAKLRNITLQPHEIAGRLILTDKLLRNWQASGSVIERLLRGALIAAKDDAFINAPVTNPATKPLGIVNSPATIFINRTTANTVVYADIVEMYGRLKTGEGLAWICSRLMLPKLMLMTDDAGQLIWQPNGRDGAPGTLLGIDVLINERSPAVGTKGDLLLCALGYYLIKRGSGPFVATSPHVLFNENKTVVKAFDNVDGRPWLNAPLPVEGGGTVSPFVGLDVPEV